MRGGGVRTVEEMLVISLVIQIAGVLLDGIDAKLGWVDGLGAQVVGLEVPANHPMALSVGGVLGPQGLDVGALGDKVPLGVRLALMLLWLCQGRECVEGVWNEHLDLVPQGLGFRGHGAEDGLVVLDLLSPRRGDLLDLVSSIADDMLGVLLQVDSGGGADQQC